MISKRPYIKQCIGVVIIQISREIIRIDYVKFVKRRERRIYIFYSQFKNFPNNEWLKGLENSTTPRLMGPEKAKLTLRTFQFY